MIIEKFVKICFIHVGDSYDTFNKNGLSVIFLYSLVCQFKINVFFEVYDLSCMSFQFISAPFYTSFI